MKITKNTVLWVAYFLIEFTLLRQTIRPTPETLPSLEEWRQSALTAAIASTVAVVLGLLSWRMRWSMRPKLLRVIAVILMGAGLGISVMEWQRVYATSTLIESRKKNALSEGVK